MAHFDDQRRAAAVRKKRRQKAEGTKKPHGIDPTTSNRDYQPDELEFMFAIHEYRVKCNRPFPTWSEALKVLKGLGYRKGE